MRLLSRFLQSRLGTGRAFSTLLLGVALWAFSLPAPASSVGSVGGGSINPGSLVYTVGNTYNSGGSTYAYLLWQPGEAATTLGTSFCIYRKDGIATSPNPYAKLAVQCVHTSPSAILALLKLGGQFDFNADVVAERINLLYADVTLQPDEIITPAPTEPNLVVAQQLAQIMEIAKGDDQILQRLYFFGRSHPGIMLSLGSAYAIEVPGNSLHTYEVRELDGGGNEIRVIGRVTLDANNPLVLTAPSRPIQVPHALPDPSLQTVRSAKDHLACRFRWATPDPLRRLVPHTFGYNLYRVKETVAISLGWDGPAPNIDALEALVNASAGDPDPDAAQVNLQAIIPDTLLDAAQAGDPTDTETIFTHDDKGPPDNRFVSGETFYYFTAARDLAGHPGPASNGTRVVYCDRLPPPAPKIESIVNVFTKGTDAQTEQLLGTQHCRLTIRQDLTADPEDAVARYHIYRWEYAQQYIYDGGDPLFRRVGTVNFAPTQQFVTFDDNGPGAPKITPASDADAGITWWYTVRSEDEQDPACVPFNLSGHSAPAYCVLRDRKGPGVATGTIQRCRSLPVTDNTGVGTRRREDIGVPSGRTGFLVHLDRTHAAIRSAEIEADVPPLDNDPDFSTTRQFGSGNQLLVFIPLLEGDPGTLRVRCRTKTGQLSNWAQVSLQPPPDNPNAVVNVYSFDCSAVARYTPIGRVPPSESPPEHEPIGPTGEIVGPNGVIVLTADTFYWRVYRRVIPDGEYELIDSGAGKNLPPNEPWEDVAPPTVNDTRVCYYAQLLDENGNAGPLTQLGCLLFKSGNLPVPLLSEPELLAAVGPDAQIKLKWVCDPVGVDRFEVWCAAEGLDDPGITGGKISPRLDDDPSQVLATEDGDRVFSPYQTLRPSGGNFGDGSSNFQLLLFVPSSTKLHFAVRAVSSGPYPGRTAGDFSNVTSKFWKEPDAPEQPVIPWPDRPLPPVQELGFDITKCIKGEGPFYAQKLPDSAPAAAGILVGSFKPATDSEGNFIAFWDKSGGEPLSNFFQFRSQKAPGPVAADDLQSILPFAVYRHQVANGANPDVVPNLVQITPLIDRLTFKDRGAFYEVNDPFFIFPTTNINQHQARIPTSGLFKRDGGFNTAIFSSQIPLPGYLQGCNGIIIVLDRLPVIQGRSYQYYLVHFTDRGEIERVIPTNVVAQ